MRKIPTYTLLIIGIILWIYYLYLSLDKLDDDKSSSLLILISNGLLTMGYFLKETLNSRKNR